MPLTKIARRGTPHYSRIRRTPAGRWRGPVVALLMVAACSAAFGVTSKVTRHRTYADFSKGRMKDVMVSSRGTIELGRSGETIVKQLDGVWSINSIVVIGSRVYLGTSPNGGVYEYDGDKLKRVYSAEGPALAAQDEAACDANEPNEVNESTPAGAEKQLANEHIFAMARDSKGKLLVGVSGRRCVLCRLEGGDMKTVFEPNDAKYIFAINVGDDGRILLATGPEGKIWRLNPTGDEPELLYDSPDKNILSLAVGKDGSVYAGSDTRGLVYKIDPATKQASVLYDSEQQEITSLLFSGSELYIAATSANVVQAEAKFAARTPLAGRPESAPRDGDSPGEGGGVKLEAANTKEQTQEKPAEGQPPPRRPPKPTQASYVYKVWGDGYVTEIFDETAVFFCLASDGNELLLGTGNSAQLYAIKPAEEKSSLVYEDEQASQLSAVLVSDERIYLGTANPAKLIELTGELAREGTYTSDLVDGGQPAMWGKLQVEADIPTGGKILVSSRSGNVKDVNDASLSAWTEPKEVSGPTQLDSPVGRFCQYKLLLRSDDGRQGPVVREVTIASTVPNLAPRVEAVNVNRIEQPAKMGMFKIGYQAKDENNDKLVYKIDFRKIGRDVWIEIEDAAETDSFEWDGRTVEDGRYEIRVTASDERGNSPETKLTGTRISEAVIVDNTGPIVEKFSTSKAGKSLTVRLKVSDELSVIGKVEYTVDSAAQWKSAVPDDAICDTTDEDFTIVIEDLKGGAHVISLKISDDIGNVTYRSFEVTMDGR